MRGPQLPYVEGRADGRPGNVLHCNRPLEFGGCYLSRKSGAVQPKPTNKDQSSTPTALGEALAASFIEESSAERLRWQSRRAVMRHDLPLDLSSVPVHARRPGID